MFKRNHIQSNLYKEVTFRTRKKWPYEAGDLLKEVQFICNFLGQDKKDVTF
jgi:hypothetical protein